MMMMMITFAVYMHFKDEEAQIQCPCRQMKYGIVNIHRLIRRIVLACGYSFEVCDFITSTESVEFVFTVSTNHSLDNLQNLAYVYD